MSSTEADSTTSIVQTLAGSSLKKLSPYKQKRKQERDAKFNRSDLNDSSPILYDNVQADPVNP